MIRFRASGIYEIMTDPRTGTGLSAGAKTAIELMAKEAVYGFTTIADSKEMRKGTACEDASIALLNAAKFARYEKNKDRRNNEFISGEPDIVAPDHMRDIKTAWSLATFPATVQQVKEIAKTAGYEWQGRAYLALFDREEFFVDYCMVSTPEELRRYESPDLHEVDHIAPHMRVTSYAFKRDAALEQKMYDKVGLAREYLKNCIAEINIDHR